jgi:hypothetical protein
MEATCSGAGGDRMCCEKTMRSLNWYVAEMYKKVAKVTEVSINITCLPHLRVSMSLGNPQVKTGISVKNPQI